MSIEYLKGLSGGRKEMWLRENRQLVMNYFMEHGREATLERFMMEEDTLDRFLHRDEIHIDNYSKAERAVYISQTAIDMARESARRCTELEARLAALTPVVQVVYALSKALQMAAALPDPGSFVRDPEKQNGGLRDGQR